MEPAFTPIPPVLLSLLFVHVQKNPLFVESFQSTLNFGYGIIKRGFVVEVDTQLIVNELHHFVPLRVEWFCIDR